MSRSIEVLLFALSLTTSCAQDAQVWFGGPFRVGTTPIDKLPEVSGLVASVQTPGLLWMHNDSGDEPRIYGISPQGRIITEVVLQGATHMDWEDIARGPGPVQGASYLYIADIGDNSARRSAITIYRIREPQIDTSIRAARLTIAADSVESFTLRYPDGARDAEAMIVDPRSGEIVIVTKREQRCRVYTIATLPVSTATATLEYVRDIPLQLVTGGDVSSDGSAIVLKTYMHVRMWKRRPGAGLAESITGAGSPLPYMPERQGEAIGFTSSADGYYTTSECENGGPASAIMFYPSANDETQARQLRDVRLPSIAVSRMVPSGTKYRVRYSMPEVERVSLTVHNAAMFRVMTLAEDSAESGPQERDFDAAKLPPGSYAVVLESPSARVSALLEIR